MPAPQSLPPQPLISFIIPAYNLPPEMLRECLDSILRLSLAEDEREIILVDDGSDVPTIDDLGDIQDQIIYVRQRNRGLSAARNMGLHCATGRYIQFVDGDDYLIQAPYEHCLDIVRYREADLVLFRETEKPQADVPFLYDGPVTGAAYMHQNNLHPSVCGYIFSRAILGSLRFPVGVVHEDEEFTPLLMLRAEHVFATKAEAYFYRRRDNSLTTATGKRHTVKRLGDTIGIILKLKDIADKSPEIDRVALNRRIAQLSMDYLYNTIRLTHSRKHLNAAIAELRQKGLFPLPDKHYTKKYTAFRRLVGHALGRQLLLAGIR